MLAIGSNSGRRYWRLLAASLLVLFAIPGVTLAVRTPRSLDQWHKGPVRYLMNRTETRTFRKLEKNKERLTFIRRFWDRRDPNPHTPENERRIVFWSRVTEANRLFADAAKPGWMTDRGKIFILLGPPNDIEERGEYDTGVSSASRGLLRWHYEGLRQASTQVMTVIAFVRQGGHNDWYLTTDPKLSSVYLNVNAPLNETFVVDSNLERVANMVPWGGGNLATAMDLGRLQEVPSERELLRAVVQAEHFLGTLEGTGIATGVGTPSKTPLVSITLALRKVELRPLLEGSAVELSQRFTVSAQLKPSGKQEDYSLIEIPEDAFMAEPRPDPADPWLRFQAIRPVPPGDWALTGVIFDRKGGDASTHYFDLRVEERPGNTPSMTGPMLASLILEAEGPAGPGTHPFRSSNHIIVPRMDQVIAASERFGLYVQVFPAPGDLAPVALDWAFERSEQKDGDYQAVGRPGHLDNATGARAWNLPPGQLATGWYHVRFTATASDGTVLVRKIEFRIAGD